MKKFFYSILGIWCAFTCLISPVWLTMTFLYITGLVYRYDFSVDEGVAVIVGGMSLTVWILLALLPNILFAKKMYTAGRKYFWITLTFMAALIILCLAVCRWNVVAFLTTPGLHL